MNSAIGQAFYRREMLEKEGGCRAKDGVSARCLKLLQIAPIDFDPRILQQVAHLCHQVLTLYEGEQACGTSFSEEIAITRERLHLRICALLRLRDQEPEELLHSVIDLELPDQPAPDLQLSLFKERWELPIAPPVNLLSDEERQRLHTLEQRKLRNNAESSNGEAQHLQELLVWEKRLKEAPPIHLPAREPPAVWDLPPVYIETIHGSHVPVVYSRENKHGVLYEYYTVTDHIVAAPDVCGGRATFKGTRLDVRHVLPALRQGMPFDEINVRFGKLLTAEAVEEARLLASQNGPEVFEHPLIPRDTMSDRP